MAHYVFAQTVTHLNNEPTFELTMTFCVVKLFHLCVVKLAVFVSSLFLMYAQGLAPGE